MTKNPDLFACEAFLLPFWNHESMIIPCAFIPCWLTSNLCWLVSKVFATLTSPKVLLRKKAQVKKVTHLKPKELQQATSNYPHDFRIRPCLALQGAHRRASEPIGFRGGRWCAATGAARSPAGGRANWTTKRSPARTHISYIYTYIISIFMIIVSYNVYG